MEKENLVSYVDLVNASRTFNLGFHLEFAGQGDSIKLSNHYHPWSLMGNEASIVYQTIIKNNLRFGYEIATAFGISSAVIGQALKITNGKLVTLDAYVEEIFNNCEAYDINTRKVNPDADGRRMANKLYEFLGIQDYVVSEIGWSPDVVSSVIERNFPDTKLDFAFIDGGHTQPQIDADVRSIIPYLKEDTLLIFHDHILVSSLTWDFLRQNGFTNFVNFNTQFSLAMLYRGNITI
jgi:hypothetical protein